MKTAFDSVDKKSLRKRLEKVNKRLRRRIMEIYEEIKSVRIDGKYGKGRFLK